MNPILSINLMGLLRSSEYAERGDVDERDFRHLWTNCYEVRIVGTDRYYRIDPATGAVRKIAGFSVNRDGSAVAAAPTANAYDPAIHGACGWPRPVAGTDRCACGLVVVRTDDGWAHFVSA